MNTLSSRSVLSTRSLLLAVLLALTIAALTLLPAPAGAAQVNVVVTASQPGSQPTAEPGSQPVARAADADSDNDEDADSDDDGHHAHRHLHEHHDNDLVSVGHDATLAAGGQADSVVAVFGSATSSGTVSQDVVSVFGDTTVNGPTADSAVAVLGNVTVNAEVGQDVVAVLGSVTLGPQAHVHGHVVSVLGTVNQDPGAIVDQGIERILPEELTTSASLRQWLGHGLMLGRPLVIGDGLGWLWGIAFTLLVVYAALALLFRDATEHCIATLNESPGKSMLVAILAVLLTPLVLFLLAVTVVGVLVIPIAVCALFIIALFGKTTVLGWIGGRCFGLRPGYVAPHPVLAVIVGGLIVMLAYTVPVLGIVAFIVLGMIGYGAVLYTLLLRVQQSNVSNVTPIGPAPGPAGPAGPASPPPDAAAAATAAAGIGAETAAAAAAAAAATAAAAVPPSTLPRAGFWIRMGALLIDTIIVGVVVHLLLNSHDDDTSNRLMLLGLAVYGAVMWKFRGTTIGGMVCDLRVVRLDSRVLDWPTACVRALGCILSLCALGLGFIWIGVDSGKQGWHDKLAGTIVVRVPKGTPLV